MALNKIWAYTQEKVRERPVAANTQPGTPHLQGSAGFYRPAVALTARGDATRTTTNIGNGVTSITYTVGGVGNASDSASVAFDGGYEFQVAGALTSTGQDVPVYITSATGTLTLTVGSNILFGFTDYPVGYVKEAGRAVVRIGGTGIGAS
jgi:hypothetical protein